MPIFQEGKDFRVGGGTFTDISPHIANNYAPLNVTNRYISDSENAAGIKLLREHTLSEAIHNSAPDPPKCLQGTREEYIRSIMAWGLDGWRKKGLGALWMRGYVGVGKSAVAHTCADWIKKAGWLGATFFFHRPNRWNDPNKFIPTIAYQLAMRSPTYRSRVNATIILDPFVFKQPIEVQFEELLVKPLKAASAKGEIEMGTIIIVDGLDECESNSAQRAIINLAITSIHEKTMPFLWAFFSRPEPNINAAFSSEVAKKVVWDYLLPVSPDTDIKAYLEDSFKHIRADHGIPDVPAWPSEKDIRDLVDRSSGLFLYAADIIRYIRQDGGHGLEQKLHSVLRPDIGSGGKASSELDQFYTLIMEQVPSGVLPNTLSLLSLRLAVSDSAPYTCSALGLSPTAFHEATSKLHSVLNMKVPQQGMPPDFSFYHVSFADFLSDPTKSGPNFCVNTPSVRQQCLAAIVKTLHHTPVDDINVLASSGADAVGKAHVAALEYLFSFVTYQDVHLVKGVLQQLSQFNWNQWKSNHVIAVVNIDEFIVKIPWRWRSKIIRPIHDGPFDRIRQILSSPKPGTFHSGHEKKTYIVGNGRKKALLVPDGEASYLLRPYREDM